MANGRWHENESIGFAARCYRAHGVDRAVPCGRTDNFGGALEQQAGRQRCKRRSPAIWRPREETKTGSDGTSGEVVERSDRCLRAEIPGDVTRESYSRTKCKCEICVGSQLVVVGR